MDRSKQLRLAGTFLACVPWTTGCGTTGTSASAPSGHDAAPSVERPLFAEPRLLDPALVPVGFRSRKPSDSQSMGAPEVELGTVSDSWNPVAQDVRPSEVPPLNVPGASGAPAVLMEDSAQTPMVASPPSRAVSRPVERLPAQVAQPDSSADLDRAFGELLARETAEPRAPQATARAAEATVARPVSPSAEMQAVNAHAEQLVRTGFRLAERGAVYSARQQFFDALALIARSLDVEQGTAGYSQALQAGRTALREAHDFAPRDGEGPAAIDMHRVVAGHRTLLLQGVPLEGLSPTIAQQRYFTLAQHQLAAAAGEQPAASLALYGLGRTASQVQTAKAAGVLGIVGEQITCYQAALLVDGANYHAANEVGVLLAGHGRLDAARDYFLQSLAVSQQAVVWQNLAAVHARLGQSDLANRAKAQGDRLAAVQPRNVTGDNLRWVDPDTFARSVSPSEGLIPPATAAAPMAPPEAPAKKRTAFWPWSRSTQR